MSQIDVTIMGQHYKLACKDDEEDLLIKAAAYLDEKMCAFRENTKIKGTDKIAVMAALTISAELFATQLPGGSSSESSVGEINHQIQSMNKVLDNVLTPQENLF